MGAALGAKLAAPDQTVICCVGDGSYMFGAPTAAHFVSRAHGLPVLFVIFNNRAWNAVKRAVLSHAPEGVAAKTGRMPLSDLEPSPDYEMVCQASGGHGERVEDPAGCPTRSPRALQRRARREAAGAAQRDLQEALGGTPWPRTSGATSISSSGGSPTSS